MIILGLALAGVVGLFLGLLGGGGSVLAVPIFVYVLGFSAKQSIAMSLAVVGVTSAFAAVGHWRAGQVNDRVALIFGVFAMVGTYAGARLAVLFSGQAQLVLFAALMLASAWFMVREPGGQPSAVEQAATVGVVPMPLALIVAEGVGVGILTGLVGVGGGFLIVPALVLLGGLRMKQAVGTSLVVIAMKSGAGFYGYLGQVDVPWSFMGMFTAVAVLGAVVGTGLVRRVPQDRLRRAFAVFLLLVGGWILWQQRALLGVGGGEVVAVLAGPITMGELDDDSAADL